MIKWRAIFMGAKGSSEASVKNSRLLGGFADGKELWPKPLTDIMTVISNQLHRHNDMSIFSV